MNILEEVVLWCIAIIAALVMFPFMALYMVCEGVAKVFKRLAQVSICILQKIFDSTKYLLKILEKRR